MNKLNSSHREWLAGVFAVLTVIASYLAHDVLSMRFGWFGAKSSGGGGLIGLFSGLLLMLLAGAFFTALLETDIREPAWLMITGGLTVMTFAGQGRFWFSGIYAAILLLIGLSAPGRRVNRWWGTISAAGSWLFLGYGMLLLSAALQGVDPATAETGRISAYVFAVETRWVLLILTIFALLGGAALYSDTWHSPVAPIAGAIFLAITLWANGYNQYQWRSGIMTDWPALPLWGWGMVERFAHTGPAVLLGGVLALPLLWRGLGKYVSWPGVKVR